VSPTNAVHIPAALAGAVTGVVGLDTESGKAEVVRIVTVDDAGTIMWESHAILRYLAAHYGQASFWSDDDATRSHSDRWMDWAQTSLQPDFLIGVFWGFYRTPEPQRNWQAINARIAKCALHFELLDRILAERAFMLGDRLTLADIPIGTHLYRYFNLSIERPSVTNVEGWYRRLQDRPAYRTHVMVPFDELRGRLDP